MQQVLKPLTSFIPSPTPELLHPECIAGWLGYKLPNRAPNWNRNRSVKAMVLYPARSKLFVGTVARVLRPIREDLVG